MTPVPSEVNQTLSMISQPPMLPGSCVRCSGTLGRLNASIRRGVGRDGEVEGEPDRVPGGVGHQRGAARGEGGERGEQHRGCHL